MSTRGRSPTRRARPARHAPPQEPVRRQRGLDARIQGPRILEGIDASLLDIVDHVLTKGIVLKGDVVLGVADIELIYLQLSAVLCAFDRIAGPSAGTRHRAANKPTVVRRPLAGKPDRRRAP
ncbi:hypothetical protein AKJ09_01665 [Labilithrix luteola]|uniref:Gas vesicle structural protein n=1 Tax=Labilithrix luteola TaxID=1391654 RepID=A0A0K1PNM6_9BACT|nr:gas vesicle protein [Labilithrix luteola]AKU95001.1 hypothetical protein AKJ09_01665 [Labilithrix luteola]